MSEEKQKRILLAMYEDGQEKIGVEVEKSPHLSRLVLRLWRKTFGTGVQIATAPYADAAEKYGPYTLIGSEKEFIEKVQEMIEKGINNIMKKNLLDKYRDFIHEHTDDVDIAFRLAKFALDDDGDIQQEIQIRVNFPGYGSVRGGGFVWFPPEFLDRIDQMDLSDLFDYFYPLDSDENQP